MRVKPPNFKLNTVQQMHDAIDRILSGRLRQAYNSQYDVDVCVRSVETGREVFEKIAIKGTALEYGRSVEKALGKVHDTFYDSSGEYTSRGMIGDVCSDVYQLLKDQQSENLKVIDMKEAHGVLVHEIQELIALTPQPLGDAACANIKLKTVGASGTKYYVVMEYVEKPDGIFEVAGKIYNNSKYQIPILYERLCLANRA